MKTALLIIDVQNDYFEGGKCELVNPLQALGNVEHVLQHFRKESQPVIFVQHINAGNIDYFFPGTDGVKIHDRINPLEGEYLVNKSDPNCFYHSNLSEILRMENITDLVVCGMMTHMCVDTTVRAARYEGGLKVTLLGDACATKDLTIDGETIPADSVHKSYMAGLNGRFADVVNTQDYLTQR